MTPKDYIKDLLKVMDIKKLSHETGVHLSTLYRIKNGDFDPSYRTMEKLMRLHKDNKRKIAARNRVKKYAGL